MNYKHPNLFVMIPYEERNRVSGYFDLSVVGEEYAKLLGDLTDELSTYAVSKNDVGENAVIIPILRAGMSMSNRLTKRLPKADLLKVLYLQGIFFSGNKSNGEIKEKSKNSK